MAKRGSKPNLMRPDLMTPADSSVPMGKYIGNCPTCGLMAGEKDVKKGKVKCVRCLHIADKKRFISHKLHTMEMASAT